MIYEKHHYHNYAKETTRFQGLHATTEWPQELDHKGQLPRTHGYSYMYAREIRKSMGITCAFDSPDLEERLKNKQYDKR